MPSSNPLHPLEGAGIIVHPQFEDDSSSQDGDHDMATDSLAAARTSDFEDQKEERLEESPLSGDKMFDPDRYVKWKKPKIQYKPSFLEKYKKTMAFETYIKLVRNHMELRIKRLIKDRENKEIQRLQVKRNPNILKDRNESQSQNICLNRYQNIPYYFQCIHYYNYQCQNISYQSYLKMCRNNIYLQQLHWHDLWSITDIEPPFGRICFFPSIKQAKPSSEKSQAVRVVDFV